MVGVLGVLLGGLLVAAASALPAAVARAGGADNSPPGPAAALDPAALAAATSLAPAADAGFVRRVYTDATGQSLTYYLHVPDGYDPRRQYPLVLLLHGGGERASPAATPAENEALLLDQGYVRVWAAGPADSPLPTVQSRWPSFVVVPQLMYPNQWVDVPTAHGPYRQAARPSDSLRLTKAILDTLQHRYPDIDPHRRYITGISLGGYGVWDAIERWPDYFAAAAPLCGAGDPAAAARLVGLPIWAFHGARDGIVPVAGSRAMIRAITAAGGHPRYTEYAATGHGIWNMVYASPRRLGQTSPFFTWLFAQRRPG
ncbi:MAG TPA: alpha/beta hydrolase-fold protein [Thermomicrobiales bacterium]|nr:alpha/beta hydrolase-fold protein [Thermomicrobiales bacterium]